ncbi:hypothetical protein AAC387_Pa06g3217 [Persea americana]
MKAVVITSPGGPEVLQVQEVGNPRVGDDERKGSYPAPEGASPYLGLECAGTVESVGKNVTRWTVGDEVGMKLLFLLNFGGGLEEVGEGPPEMVVLMVALQSTALCIPLEHQVEEGHQRLPPPVQQDLRRARGAHLQALCLQGQPPVRTIFSLASRVSPDNQTLTLEKKAVDDFKAIDPTSLLSDSLLLRIFSLLPSSQYLPNSLVCKRWLALHGRLRRSLKLLDSSSFTSRFSDLTEIDLIAASVHSQSPRSSSYIFLTLPIHSDDSAARFVLDELFLPPDYIDIGLRTLSSGCPNLWKLTLIAETKAGLASIAAECPTLQELELHRCTNDVLSTIASFENLQILRVIAFVEGLYDDSSISDVGLTILAHDCRCLVKLELSGCEGSYEGISAIGPCCPMLEELTLCDHWMDGGWLAPLSFCGNLKTLRLEGCKKVDANPGQVEHLGLCLALKTLQLRRCQLQDKESLSTLFIVCATVREIIFQNFWGLDNDMFSIASICRYYDEFFS